MLKDVHIQKFRSCDDVRLQNIGGMLVLIGRNGAGKTNILKAIEWICKFSYSGLERPQTVSGRKVLPAITSDGHVSITFAIADEIYCYELKKTTGLTSPSKFEIDVEEKIFVCSENDRFQIVGRKGEHLELFYKPVGASQSLEVSKTISALAAIMAIFPEESDIRQHATKITEFLSSVKYYPLHNFDEVFGEPFVYGKDYQKWTSNKSVDPNSISSFMFKIIDMFLERYNSFFELNELMGENGLGIIDNIGVVEMPLDEKQLFNSESERNSIILVTFNQKFGDEWRRFSIDELSFGTKRLLSLLISMLYDKASVSLLEQPEDGVHTALVDKLAPLFRSYSKNSQYIVASHSTTILNRTYPSEVYFVSKPHGDTKVRQLDESEIDAAEAFLKEDGPLSEFLELIGNN